MNNTDDNNKLNLPKPDMKSRTSWKTRLTHWPMGEVDITLKVYLSNSFFRFDILSNSNEMALWRMPHNPTDGKSTLVQVMAWCRQATSHYPSWCWPRSLSPYGINKPQWVNSSELAMELSQSCTKPLKYSMHTRSTVHDIAAAHLPNKMWWLCLVHTSTTRFAQCST